MDRQFNDLSNRLSYIFSIEGLLKGNYESIFRKKRERKMLENVLYDYYDYEFIFIVNFCKIFTNFWLCSHYIACLYRL